MLDFNDWLDDLEKTLWVILRESIDEYTSDEIRELYERGLSPENAVRELYEGIEDTEDDDL